VVTPVPQHPPTQSLPPGRGEVRRGVEPRPRPQRSRPQRPTSQPRPRAFTPIPAFPLKGEGGRGKWLRTGRNTHHPSPSPRAGERLGGGPNLARDHSVRGRGAARHSARCHNLGREPSPPSRPSPSRGKEGFEGGWGGRASHSQSLPPGRGEVRRGVETRPRPQCSRPQRRAPQCPTSQPRPRAFTPIPAFPLKGEGGRGKWSRQCRNTHQPSPSPRAGGRLGGGSNLARGHSVRGRSAQRHSLGREPSPPIPAFPLKGEGGKRQVVTPVPQHPPTQSLPPGRGEARRGVEPRPRPQCSRPRRRAPQCPTSQPRPRAFTPIPAFPLKGEGGRGKWSRQCRNTHHPNPSPRAGGRLGGGSNLARGHSVRGRSAARHSARSHNLGREPSPPSRASPSRGKEGFEGGRGLDGTGHSNPSPRAGGRLGGGSNLARESESPRVPETQSPRRWHGRRTPSATKGVRCESEKSAMCQSVPGAPWRSETRNPFTEPARRGAAPLPPRPGPRTRGRRLSRHRHTKNRRLPPEIAILLGVAPASIESSRFRPGGNNA
jgi:hypothetical protein